MPTIQELQDLVDDLEAQLERAEKDLREARIAASGLSIGDVVISTRDGREYRVHGIYPNASNTWVEGKVRNKDGSWSTLMTNLCNQWRKAP